LRIFSQNIWKNNSIIDTILKLKAEYDIIFIQELSWSTIQTIPSSRSCKGESLVRVVNHPNWLTFSRSSESESDHLRMVTYVNIRLISLRLALHRDIINHRDFLLISFFNNNNIFWLLNVYSDSSHTALKYLKNIEVNIQNFLIITEDFNICDNL